MSSLELAKVNLVGTSVGSMVAQYFGANDRNRLLSRTLVAAGPLVPETAWPIWDKRVAAASRGGLSTQVSVALPGWFSGAVDQGVLEVAESMILTTTVAGFIGTVAAIKGHDAKRSEEHTSELQSLMRISYAVFCLKKKKTLKNTK